eukprot:6482090-Amphidinium_carterae.1
MEGFCGAGRGIMYLELALSMNYKCNSAEVSTTSPENKSLGRLAKLHVHGEIRKFMPPAELSQPQFDLLTTANMTSTNHAKITKLTKRQ